MPKHHSASAPIFVSGLLYPQMKAERAAEHLRQLREEWRRFQSDAPYTITTRSDPAAGLHVIRVTLNPAPSSIPIAIGEFAYALRSSLDQLAWQLGLLSGRTPRRTSAFPIHDHRSKRSDEQFAQATQDMPTEAVEIVRTLQPHTRADAHEKHPLSQLGRLCNLDKHVTVGFSHSLIRVDTSGPVAAPILQRQLITEHDSAVELAIPIELKDVSTFTPQPPEMILGEPLEAPGPDFLASEAEIIEIHRFVTVEVFPRFVQFFPPEKKFLIT